MVWVISLFTTDVSTRRVSPVITLLGIRVCIDLVERDVPLV